MIDNTIWAERYRPQSLDDFVGNDHVKKKFTQYIEQNDPPHILLYGKAGTGKCLDFDEEIVIKMDVSDDEYKILKYFEIT